MSERNINSSSPVYYRLCKERVVKEVPMSGSRLWRQTQTNVVGRTPDSVVRGRFTLEPYTTYLDVG